MFHVAILSNFRGYINSNSNQITLQSRSAFGLTIFADNRIIVVGGMGADKNALDGIEELSEDGTHWTQISTDLQSSLKHIAFTSWPLCLSFYRSEAQRQAIAVFHVRGAQGLCPRLLTLTALLYLCMYIMFKCMILSCKCDIMIL